MILLFQEKKYSMEKRGQCRECGININSVGGGFGGGSSSVGTLFTATAAKGVL
jgi:hypothetical protein